jgi:hypothetical protein
MGLKSEKPLRRRLITPPGRGAWNFYEVARRPFYDKAINQIVELLAAA